MKTQQRQQSQKIAKNTRKHGPKIYPMAQYEKQRKTKKTHTHIPKTDKKTRLTLTTHPHCFCQGRVINFKNMKLHKNRNNLHNT